MVVRSGMSRPSSLGNAIPTASRQLVVRIGANSRSKPDSTYHRPAVPSKMHSQRSAAGTHASALVATPRPAAGDPRPTPSRGPTAKPVVENVWEPGRKNDPCHLGERRLSPDYSSRSPGGERGPHRTPAG